ncbi:uncharacterized protein LOC115219222 [Octopus sinensis]|uniref:Uncharacterized protein LOC115219222 n=1 Tax=Octopus sinensis TaxID=2607531 RepID=A0A6P7T4L2_9MOLL|nr:uncharacterized protein LOC115219222 [Octopus sinensis]
MAAVASRVSRSLLYTLDRWYLLGAFLLFFVVCSEVSPSDNVLTNKDNSTLSCFVGSWDNFTNTRIVACSEPKVSHCIVFKYVNTTSQNNGISGNKTQGILFACDHQLLCKQASITIQNNTSYQGLTGQLICCEGNKCNNHTLAGPEPPITATCYQASRLNGTVVGQQYEECHLTDGMCVKNTTVALISGALSVQERYSCQPVDLCDNLNLTTTHISCANITNPPATSEICCCPFDLCFVPTWFTNNSNNNNGELSSIPPSQDSGSDHGNSDTASPKATTTVQQLIRPGVQPSGTHTKGQKNWLLVTCLVLVFVIFFCIIGGVVLVAVRYRLTRRKQPVTLAYTRIAADSPAGNGDEDIQMLLG